MNGLQEDFLKELASIGMGHASVGLSKLLNRRIDVVLPVVRRMDLKEVPDFLGGAEQTVCGVYSTLTGNLNGTMLLVFPQDSVRQLLKLWLKMNDDEDDGLSAYERSAISELNNVFVGAYVRAICQLTGYQMIGSVPALAIDMLGALLDELLVTSAQESNETLMMETAFSIHNTKITGYFLLIFNKESLEKLMSSICQSKE